MNSTTMEQPVPLSWQRAWLNHSLSFVHPLYTLFFLSYGPWSWWSALLLGIPIHLGVLVDRRSPMDHSAPDENWPDWPFDIQLYILIALHFANLIMLGVMASQLHLWPPGETITTLANAWAVFIVAGVNAGYSGIVLAHELVHRKEPHLFFLGRLILASLFYEHFTTEHVRGHHVRVATPDDPATARYGETFRDFYKRTVRGQFLSAWQLENDRTGIDGTPSPANLLNPRILYHRCFQGILMALGLALAMTFTFGWIALALMILQARMAITLLEIVNYIEHWGLVREKKNVTPRDSWDANSWFTLHTLVGLSRHSDHHAWANRPYHKLRYHEESPRMPTGYYGTIYLVFVDNARYIKLAKRELQRLGRVPESAS